VAVALSASDGGSRVSAAGDEVGDQAGERMGDRSRGTRDRRGSGAGAPKMLWAWLLLAACCGAAAQEYCVACSGPNAVYRCVIEGAQPNGGQPLQMLCLTAMAKAGNHAACSVTRGTVFDCDGPVKRVPWTAANAAPAPPAPQQPSAGRAGAAAPPAADPNAPPQTVVEMAQRANQQTAEQMKKAGENISQGAKSVGDAVSNATKKTWDCMTSLFTRC
jgi:hypothetical protein